MERQRSSRLLSAVSLFEQNISKNELHGGGGASYLSNVARNPKAPLRRAVSSRRSLIGGMSDDDASLRSSRSKRSVIDYESDASASFKYVSKKIQAGPSVAEKRRKAREALISTQEAKEPRKVSSKSVHTEDTFKIDPFADTDNDDDKSISLWDEDDAFSKASGANDMQDSFMDSFNASLNESFNWTPQATIEWDLDGSQKKCEDDVSVVIELESDEELDMKSSASKRRSSTHDNRRPSHRHSARKSPSKPKATETDEQSLESKTSRISRRSSTSSVRRGRVGSALASQRRSSQRSLLNGDDNQSVTRPSMGRRSSQRSLLNGDDAASSSRPTVGRRSSQRSLLERSSSQLNMRKSSGLGLDQSISSIGFNPAIPHDDCEDSEASEEEDLFKDLDNSKTSLNSKASQASKSSQISATSSTAPRGTYRKVNGKWVRGIATESIPEDDKSVVSRASVSSRRSSRVPTRTRRNQ